MVCHEEAAHQTLTVTMTLTLVMSLSLTVSLTVAETITVAMAMALSSPHQSVRCSGRWSAVRNPRRRNPTDRSVAREPRVSKELRKGEGVGCEKMCGRKVARPDGELARCEQGCEQMREHIRVNQGEKPVE